MIEPDTILIRLRGVKHVPACNTCVFLPPVFLDSPYNYLVDPSVREIMGINLKDAVVIFDEVSNTDASLASLSAGPRAVRGSLCALLARWLIIRNLAMLLLV